VTEEDNEGLQSRWPAFESGTLSTKICLMHFLLLLYFALENQEELEFNVTHQLLVYADDANILDGNNK
jgi:hypothetical protein